MWEWRKSVPGLLNRLCKKEKQRSHYYCWFSKILSKSLQSSLELQRQHGNTNLVENTGPEMTLKLTTPKKPKLDFQQVTKAPMSTQPCDTVASTSTAD